MPVQNNILSYSPGTASGTDIRAGLAQVFDFKPLMDRLYGEPMREQEEKLKAAQQAKQQALADTQKLTDINIEAIPGRQVTAQEEMRGYQEKLRDYGQQLNDFNINPNAPLPVAVANNPKVQEIYRKFHNAKNAFNTIALQEKSAIDTYNERKKLVDKGEAVWRPEATLAINYKKDPEQFKDKWIETRFGPGAKETYASLSPTQKQRVDEMVNADYNNLRIGNVVPDQFRSVNKVDRLKLLKDLKSILGDDITEEEWSSNGYIQKLQEKGIDPAAIRAAAMNSLSLDEFENTSLGMELQTLANRSNLLYAKAISDFQALPDEDLAKLGVTREELNDPAVAQRVFSMAAIDDKGKLVVSDDKKVARTINPITGMPMREYSTDYAGIQDYWGDTAIGILSNSEVKKSLQADPFALRAQQRAWELADREIQFQEQAPPRLSFGGELVDALSAVSVSIGGKPYKRNVGPDATAYDLETGKPMSEVGDTGEYTIDSAVLLPINSKGEPAKPGEESTEWGAFYLGYKQGESITATEYAALPPEEQKKFVFNSKTGRASARQNSTSKKTTNVSQALIPMSPDEVEKSGMPKRAGQQFTMPGNEVPNLW